MIRALFIAAWLAIAAGPDFTGTWTGVANWDGNAPAEGVCVSLWTGTGVSGNVTFDGGGDTADITAGRVTDARLEFEAKDASAFQLTGDEHALSGTVKAGQKHGTISLSRYSPSGLANSFGPPGNSPVPVHRTQPEYTPEAKAAKLQGGVNLKVDVLPSGAPGSIQVGHGLGMGLDEKAIECVRQWKFTPPRADCKAVRTQVQLVVIFRLP